jgi:hypothetical protein
LLGGFCKTPGRQGAGLGFFLALGHRGRPDGVVRLWGLPMEQEKRLLRQFAQIPAKVPRSEY